LAEAEIHQPRHRRIKRGSAWSRTAAADVTRDGVVERPLAAARRATTALAARCAGDRPMTAEARGIRRPKPGRRRRTRLPTPALVQPDRGRTQKHRGKERGDATNARSAAMRCHESGTCEPCWKMLTGSRQRDHRPSRHQPDPFSANSQACGSEHDRGAAANTSAQIPLPGDATVNCLAPVMIREGAPE